MKLITLTTEYDAEKIVSFLTGPNAYEWPLSHTEKEYIRKGVLNSLKKDEVNVCWYYKDKMGNILGAGLIEQLPDTKAGYSFEWLAVHKDYRNQGLGKTIIKQVEDFLRSQDVRFISLDTSEDNKAQKLYERLGYKKVGYIPEYFDDKVGRVLFYKRL